ncbi:hypothetical protein ACY2DF_09585 [Enterococcus durans]|uniref:hypothetical protein n=1 Tax=Enterococcus durans TaxID=53345 RepID=UPI0028902BC2|nr:hypothetical protein [Enterococcus durans]MDT2771992.1 hypothetical protein [Enterococcus durans]
MNDIKMGQVWENKHLFNDAYDVVVCWVNDGFVWSHYTDDDDLVKESQSVFLRLRRLKSDPYFLNDNQKIVLEWWVKKLNEEGEDADPLGVICAMQSYDCVTKQYMMLLLI